MVQNHSNKTNLVESIIERAVKYSIGPTTLRGQGIGVYKKSIETIINIAKSPNFKTAITEIDSDDKFQNFLNKETNKLKNKYLGYAKGNYGAARKSWNLFFEQLYFDRILYEYFNIKKIEHYLEFPLDSKAADFINNSNKIEWKGIKHLDHNTSNKFQKAASEIAKNENIKRVELDLISWNSKYKKL